VLLSMATVCADPMSLRGHTLLVKAPLTVWAGRWRSAWRLKGRERPALPAPRRGPVRRGAGGHRNGRTTGSEALGGFGAPAQMPRRDRQSGCAKPRRGWLGAELTTPLAKNAKGPTAEVAMEPDYQVERTGIEPATPCLQSLEQGVQPPTPCRHSP
jgi:hypothetical protein